MVERQKTVFSVCGLHVLQAITKIVRIVVEKTPLLDKVDEHHPVQHERGVPFPISDVLNAFDEFQKDVMLLLETFVELLSDFLDVKGRARLARDVGQRGIGFLSQGEDKASQLLNQGLARLPMAVDVLGASGPAGQARVSPTASAE